MKIEIKVILKNVVRITTTDERWYIKDEKTYTSSTWITSYVPSKELTIWMAKKGWDEAELVKQEAMARGSRVHKGCEIIACGGEVSHNDSLSDGEGEIKELTAEEYEGIWSFERWCEEVKPKFISTEKTVFNEEHNYAGTLDAICEIDGTVWLLDYKTSANIYLSHKAQLSSYLYSDDIFKQAVHSDKGAMKMGILQLGYKRNRKGWKFTEIEDEFDSFLAAKHFWAKANEGKKPLQKDFPLSLKLKEN